MNIWKKFNNLPEPKRFMVFFFGIAVPCLVVIPVASRVLGYSMELGQLIGILIMTGLCASKMYWERK